MRMNIRLVHASQFLRQFRLDVRHKPDKEHIVPDALSRLASLNHSKKAPEYSELNALYTCSLIDISDDFRHRLVDDYKKDPWCARLIQQIDDNEKLGEDAVPLSFIRGRYFSSRLETFPSDSESGMDNPPDPPAESGLGSRPPPDSAVSALESLPEDADLIYHIDRIIGIQRLCIPSSLVKEILQLAHGNGHPEFQRCYEIVSAS